MDKKTTLIVFGVGIAALGVTMLLVALFAPASSAKFADATAMLAFITGAAVTIERIIEAMWTVLGGTLGTYWPLSWVRKQTDTLVSSLDATVTTVQTQVQRVLAQVEGSTVWAQEQLPRIQGEMTALRDRIAELRTMAPDNQRLQLAAASAAQYINGLEKAYSSKSPELQRALNTAKATIDGMQDFLASFKDNPGRRLISIFLGAIIGVVVAGAFGLDVFKAVLDNQDTRNIGHILITGVMIGLGSSPTHEVIRAIQEYKKNRKGENASRPDLP
jgi:hypothetical protein